MNKIIIVTGAIMFLVLVNSNIAQKSKVNNEIKLRI